MGFRGEQIGKNGVVYIFDATSVWNAAKQWEDIPSCAMHCCSEEEALYLCKPGAEDSFGIPAPSSQRISELLKGLNEDSRMRFYKKCAALCSEKEYLALDITSISSWSELIQYVEPGYNRNHEQLP